MILWRDKYYPTPVIILPLGPFLMLHQKTSATLHPLRSYWIRKSYLEYLYKALSSLKPNELSESLQGNDP